MSETSEHLFVDEISNLKLSFNSNDSFCIDEKFELGDSHKEFHNVHADPTKAMTSLMINLMPKAVATVPINSKRNSTTVIYYSLNFQ